MSSKLDRVLDSIDPTRTLDEVGRRADEAINTFGPAPSQITAWDPFRTCLIRFIHHVEGRVLRLPGLQDGRRAETMSTVAAESAVARFLDAVPDAKPRRSGNGLSATYPRRPPRRILDSGA